MTTGVASKDSVEQRLDRIEARLEQLSGLLEQALPLAATAGDVVDAWAKKAGDLDERVRAVGDLAERASRPETVRGAQAALSISEQIPQVMATAADVVDSTLRAHPELLDRLKALEPVVERLTRPQTLDVLTKLLEVLEAAPGTATTVLDAVDQQIQAAGGGRALDEAVRSLARVAQGALRTLSSKEAVQLFEQGAFSPEAIELVNAAASSLAEAHASPPTGPMGAMMAARDPDVRRSLGIAVGFARGFGRRVRAYSETKLLKAQGGHS